MTTISLKAFNRISIKYMIVAILVAMFVPSGPLEAAKVKLQILRASDPSSFSGFGYDVAVDGDTAMIGAYNTDEGHLQQGAVYVFTLRNGRWIQTTKLTGDSDDANFGHSIALDGNTALIGGGYQLPGHGVVYVFTRSGRGWSRRARLKVKGLKVGFGHSVALDGKTAVIGTYSHGTNPGGAAYIYTGSGGSWRRQKKLIGGRDDRNDKFGESVAVSGNTVLVGAPGDGPGAVYVFTRKGKKWRRQARLTTKITNYFDRFGAAVALDGNTALIGTPGYYERGITNYHGAVFVFTRGGTKWKRQAVLVTEEAERENYFGSSVALDGDTAAIGAHGNDVRYSGAAYLFTRTDGKWTEVGDAEAKKPRRWDHFGISVAVDKNRALVGYPGAKCAVGTCGAAYMFTGVGPGTLAVTPKEPFMAIGIEGGPFIPKRKVYRIKNEGGDSLSLVYYADFEGHVDSRDKAWISFKKPDKVRLKPGKSTKLTVKINDNAKNLRPGVYTGKVHIKNGTNGRGDTHRKVVLTVLERSNGVLKVTPAQGVISEGPRGGPFSPKAKTYTLKNTKSKSRPIHFEVKSSAKWLAAKPESGLLDGGDTKKVKVRIKTSEAKLLKKGTYKALLQFINNTNGKGNAEYIVELKVK